MPFSTDFFCTDAMDEILAGEQFTVAEMQEVLLEALAVSPIPFIEKEPIEQLYEPEPMEEPAKEVVLPIVEVVDLVSPPHSPVVIDLTMDSDSDIMDSDSDSDMDDLEGATEVGSPEVIDLNSPVMDEEQAAIVLGREFGQDGEEQRDWVDNVDLVELVDSPEVEMEEVSDSDSDYVPPHTHWA